MNWAKKIITHRESEKMKLIKGKKQNTKLLYLFDLIGTAMSIVTLIFCMGTIVYMLRYEKIEGMDIILDFIIAAVAGMLLLLSLINRKLSDESKYIVSGAIITLAYSIGFIFIMIIALRLKDASIARKISLASLIVSGILEIKDYCNFQCRYATKRYKDKEFEIENLEGKSIFDNEFDTKK